MSSPQYQPEQQPVQQPQEQAQAESVWYSPQQLEEIVKAFVMKERQAHTAEIGSLKQQVEALAQSVVGTIPTMVREHGAGNGTEVASTWSQWEQEMARFTQEAARVAKVAAPIVEAVLPNIPGL